MTDDGACETPLSELLARVPADARMTYEHSSTHHQMIPVGNLCNRAADRITSLEAELAKLRSDEAVRRIIAAVMTQVSIGNRNADDHPTRLNLTAAVAAVRAALSIEEDGR
jgi:hypothetical protein